MNDYKYLVSSPEVKELERKDRNNRIITAALCFLFLSVAKKVIMVDIEEGMPHFPFLELAYEDAQNLTDELYYCGVRPTDGAGTAGSMKATQNHLEDMRAIVATKLNVPFKKG